jgi:transposase
MAISQAERVQVVERMVAGQTWPAASEAVGIQISPASCYRWVQVWRVEGSAGLAERRQGHASKMTPEVRAWLADDCTQAPDTPSGEIRAQLQARFGVSVSRGHLNRVRRELEISRPKKKSP